MFERGEVVVNKASVGAGWQRAILTLTGTVVGVVVVGTLYWAQAVFIPVALAAFLTFLLSPLVNRLRQRGLPRTPSVIVAVLMAAAVLGGVGWLVTAQITSLLRELPKYRETVREKVEAVKQATAGTGGLGEMIEEITAGGKPAPRRRHHRRRRRRRRGRPEGPGRRGGGARAGPHRPP